LNGYNFFSEFFKPLSGITAYHHYKVSKKEPGIVTVKEYANSPEEKFNIFKKGITASLLQGRKPTPIVPKGLDAKRQMVFVW